MRGPADASRSVDIITSILFKLRVPLEIEASPCRVKSLGMLEKSNVRDSAGWRVTKMKTKSLKGLRAIVMGSIQWYKFEIDTTVSRFKYKRVSELKVQSSDFPMLLRMKEQNIGARNIPLYEGLLS